MNTVRRSFAVFCLVLILSVLCTQTVLAADHVPPIQGGEEITQYVTSILQIKSIADANTFLGGFDMTLLLIIGAVGLVLALFGYRLLKLAVALIGFAAGWTAASIGYDYAIGAGLISDASSRPEYLPTVVSLIGGAICALIAFKLLKFGIFVASAAGTFFVLSGISAFNALVDSIVAEFDTDKAAQTSVIHIAANDPDFAGNYSDTVTFTLTVKSN